MFLSPGRSAIRRCALVLAQPMQIRDLLQNVL